MTEGGSHQRTEWVLTELVALKRMKEERDAIQERLDSEHMALSDDEIAFLCRRSVELLQEYEKRKPQAWENAKELVDIFEARKFIVR